MIVYMFINTVTERCYVGSSIKTLEARSREHWDKAKHGATDSFHRAIREWPQHEYWEACILANCSSPDEMLQAEAAWIRICSADESGVGYNSRSMDGTLNRTRAPRVANGEAWKNPRAAVPRADMSQAQLEFFRQCGRKGAKHREEMTEAEREYYRECGRRGAQRSRLKRLASSRP